MTNTKLVEDFGDTLGLLGVKAQDRRDQSREPNPDTRYDRCEKLEAQYEALQVKAIEQSEQFFPADSSTETLFEPLLNLVHKPIWEICPKELQRAWNALKPKLLLWAISNRKAEDPATSRESSSGEQAPPSPPAQSPRDSTDNSVGSEREHGISTEDTAGDSATEVDDSLRMRESQGQRDTGNDWSVLPEKKPNEPIPKGIEIPKDKLDRWTQQLLYKDSDLKSDQIAGLIGGDAGGSRVRGTSAWKRNREVDADRIRRGSKMTDGEFTSD
jgi:hypothetical protein